MNIEREHFIEEKNDKRLNAIDNEFDSLESDFSLEERIELTRVLFDEVFNSPNFKNDFDEHVQKVYANKDNELKHFFLPNIPGGSGNIKTIREGYDTRSEYLKSDKRIFLKIGQGEMWIIPKNENPYFQISMSECSAIVGKNSDNFIVAHISYSAIDELQAVINFMNNMGINAENIYAIASIGESQKRNSDNEYTKRAFDLDHYIALGILAKNIHQFECDTVKNKQDDSRLISNVTHVIGCNDALFKYSFDLKRTPRANNTSQLEERIGDFKNKEVIKI